MPRLDIPRTRDLLQKFDFSTLFIEELGWSRPTTRKAVPWTDNGTTFERRQIAELSGVVVFEIATQGGSIPDAKARATIHKEIAKLHHENLLIFLDQKRTQSLWYWVKREGGKTYPREHLYVRGQPGDLFLSKLGTMVVDLSDFDETGAVPVVEVASRLKQSLDVEKVTKRFYREFSEQHLIFLELIQGIDDERQRHWYASVLLNRLMFIYFLQRKYFLDNGNANYLQDKLAESQSNLGKDKFFSTFLKALFFEGFAKPEEERSPEARRLLGTIRYLNGGLFLPHQVEQAHPDAHVPDKAFENLFSLFERYSWNLNDTPGGDDNEINPDVLGYIFEKYINQKAFGAYYTRPEITEYLCEQTIFKLVLEKANAPDVPGLPPTRRFDAIADLLLNLDAPLCKQLLLEILPSLSLLDPACGSGAFLVAAMRTLISLYSAIIGKIEFLHDRTLTEWLHKVRKEHTSLAYFIKKRIITDNLFGVDIMDEAVEIAKLRLFLALVASAQTVEQLEPLPNIDFNILAGNSLIGLMRVNDEDFERRQAQDNLFRKNYHQILAEKNRLIDTYRHAATYAEDLRTLRDDIEKKKQEATTTLNDILLDEFTKLGIKFGQATWDEVKKQEGKPKKRALTIADIVALQPFHWGYEFDEIINQRGGFDVIITNPPWEVFQTSEKEFFQEYVPTIQKNKIRIEDWKKQQATLMQNATLRKAWLDYSNKFPHVSKYFKTALQYKNQLSVVNGKNVGSKINLYSYFVEQCFNLLRGGGRCGIITPGSIYTDLGVKQLREMLLSQTKLDTLLGLSNEKFIFDGVHHAQRFCILVFEKGGRTESFKSSFRINPREAVSPERLDTFLNDEAEHLQISVPLIYRLAPDSLSIMEFKNGTDIRIAEKMLSFPLLGEEIEGKWNLTLTTEFNMTTDSGLFKPKPGSGRLPLYEGKMIHQFDHRWGEPKYWLDEKEAAGELRAARSRYITQVAKRLGLDGDDTLPLLLDYKMYRVAFRDVAASTNERTMIMTVLPPNVFCPHTMSLEQVYAPYIENGKLDPNYQSMNNAARLFVCAVMNSFVVDAWLRRSVTNHLSFFSVYGVPVPRLTKQDSASSPLVNRAAKLICTTPEFDDLARDVGLGSHKNGVTNPTERAKLRAELDGLIAHLYGLTEEEFTYILTTFPLVPEPVKVAAQNAYRDVERGLIT
jgi:hypothetical protein